MSSQKIQFSPSGPPVIYQNTLSEGSINGRKITALKWQQTLIKVSTILVLLAGMALAFSSYSLSNFDVISFCSAYFMLYSAVLSLPLSAFGLYLHSRNKEKIKILRVEGESPEVREQEGASQVIRMEEI